MGSEQLIANELLAFIQHAIDTMDEVSIMQICKSNFKEEEICNSKVLLYQTLGKGNRIPSRRRDEKGERSLQDIISLLKETDPDDVPAFVAKQLHKLPPVTFDHVDVTRLLKDITTLKAGLVEPVSRNLCGTASTGPNHLLRPEIKSTQLYVSRVHWSTKVEEVVDYIRKKSNFTLRVERLESRHKVNFSSFVVSVPTHHLATFMKEDFWPQGVVFRKFRGRLPADTARHTSPTSRVK
ncbi:uncharacterized protein ACR2FA_000295 [Aphomia sociella]